MVSFLYRTITGCIAINLLNTGGVNFALELKTVCYQCIISDCIVDTATKGVVFGNDQINAFGCQQCVDQSQMAVIRFLCNAINHQCRNNTATDITNKKLIDCYRGDCSFESI